MKGPCAVIADQLKSYEEITQISENLWVLARPLGFPSWRERWVRAWHVFTGRADALYWKGQ